VRIGFEEKIIIFSDKFNGLVDELSKIILDNIIYSICKKKKYYGVEYKRITQRNKFA